jgi:hypothetical protein
MGRHLTYILSGGLVVAALGCGDSNRSLPTSPELAISVGTCDVTTARGLVNSVFATAARTPARNLLQTIQNSGAKTEASTNAGFDLFASLSTDGIGTASDRSTFVNAILPCQNFGTQTLSLPIDFTGAFGANGAFAVRGGSTTDAAAVVSHDGVWGLEPLLNTSVTPAVRYTWDQITHGPNPFNPASKTVNKRFLAYGAPIVDQNFTSEQQVGSIFDWFTLPTLTFNPGVVVGTCLTDNTGTGYLIQHHAQNDGGEIVPSATPSFCSATASLSGTGTGPFALAHRVLDFFRPEPLMAAALGTRPPGGSVGSLSPNAAINPGQIQLAYPANAQVADGRTNQVLRFTNGDIISVTVTPAGQTPMDGVQVQLIANTNFGTPVQVTGGTATTQNGVATFPNLSISKAGGYRLVATIAGFGQNNASGFTFSNASSNGFNLKQTK